jgi:hypothetical protein
MLIDSSCQADIGPIADNKLFELVACNGLIRNRVGLMPS